LDGGLKEDSETLASSNSGDDRPTFTLMFPKEMSLDLP
jgi:hypothetical protein